MERQHITQFAESIAKELPAYLEQSAEGKKILENSTITVQNVLKNNVTLTGIHFTPKDFESGIKPIVYVDDFYKAYKNNQITKKEILRQISDCLLNQPVLPQEKLADLIFDYEKAKSRIIPVLCNTELNTERLKNIVHQEFDDLSCIYKIFLPFGPKNASVTVTEQFLNNWNITIEDIHKQAIANLDRSCFMEQIGCFLNSISHSNIGQLDAPMFIVSAHNNLLGASCILNTQFMNEIAEGFGEDFYILPSSIHECIVVPESAVTSVEDLNNMITFINKESVEDEEILSNHAYAYDSVLEKIVDASEHDLGEYLE